jgi:hypothetical protein
VDLFQVPKLRRDNIFRTQVRLKTSGSQQEESKVEAFETLEIFQVWEEIASSGGGATTAIRSAAEEEIWTVESHVQTPRSEQEEDQIWAVRSERKDQQSLDPEEGARGLNPSIVYRRVDFAKSRSSEEIGTIHRQRTGGSRLRGVRRIRHRKDCGEEESNFPKGEVAKSFWTIGFRGRVAEIRVRRRIGYRKISKEQRSKYPRS